MEKEILAKKTYYWAINHGFKWSISEKKAVKCFDKLISRLDPDEQIDFPFIGAYGYCFIATKKRLIQCKKRIIGYKYKELRWDQVKDIYYNIKKQVVILFRVDGKETKIYTSNTTFTYNVLKDLINSHKPKGR